MTEKDSEKEQAGTDLGKSAAETPQLPEETLPAWRAWEEMQHSKQNHYSFMLDLDEKYPLHSGQKPTFAEGLHLQALLDVHDEKVKAFSAAMQQIKDPESRMALIKAMQDPLPM